MFAVGACSPSAIHRVERPYGTFADEMDAGTDDLEADE
jgi:hypothetical protein